MRVTINAQPKADEEDIFKAGTLVAHNDGWVILVTDCISSDRDTFAGITIDSPHRPNGHYANDWSKYCFVKFIGNVLLEQEA